MVREPRRDNLANAAADQRGRTLEAETSTSRIDDVPRHLSKLEFSNHTTVKFSGYEHIHHREATAASHEDQHSFHEHGAFASRWQIERTHVPAAGKGKYNQRGSSKRLVEKRQNGEERRGERGDLE